MNINVINPSFTKSNEEGYYIVTGKVLEEELLDIMVGDKNEL